METTHLLARPAPRYEHSGHWYGSPQLGLSVELVAPAARASRPSASAERAPEPTARDARTFVVSAMTQVLEVLDRRRPVARVAELVVPHVVDQIIALQRIYEVAAAGAESAPSTAALRRVHIQMCGPGEAEFFGNYLRGERVLAFAGRVEHVSQRVRKTPGTEPYRRSKRTELRWRIRSIALG
ncbi:Rv3235 family protein [Gordonia sp. CPCC 205333]|uniref:Rv3235 family protein n=1 Tax=Gordonia sp. CPCC 205333 TaxID=3140790 RepID=UPI003AF40683